MSIDVAISGDRNVIKKEAEKILEYKDLTIEACNTDTTQTQPHRIANAQRTENQTTDVIIQQNSRKLLMMDILISETC